MIGLWNSLGPIQQLAGVMMLIRFIGVPIVNLTVGSLGSIDDKRGAAIALVWMAYIGITYIVVILAILQTILY